jgi:hypothetical protein
VVRLIAASPVQGLRLSTFGLGFDLYQGLGAKQRLHAAHYSLSDRKVGGDSQLTDLSVTCTLGNQRLVSSSDMVVLADLAPKSCLTSFVARSLATELDLCEGCTPVNIGKVLPGFGYSGAQLHALGTTSGVEGVIDKDLSAPLLAEELDADVLLLLTDVSAVWTRWRCRAAAPSGARPWPSFAV